MHLKSLSIVLLLSVMTQGFGQSADKSAPRNYRGDIANDYAMECEDLANKLYSRACTPEIHTLKNGGKTCFYPCERYEFSIDTSSLCKRNYMYNS